MPVLQPAEPWQQDRPLRDRGAVQARGPQGLAARARDDARGGADLPRRPRHPLLPRAAEDPLPRPGQGARRAAPAGRRPAHARVHDEGLLLASIATRRGSTRATSCTSARLRRGSSTAAALRWYEVESDVGMMGGTGAHEYMAPCAAGENEVALAPGYAANVEVASAERAAGRAAAARSTSRARCRRPGLTTVDEVAEALGVAAGRGAEGDARDRRGPRDGPGAGARRPPPERDQAPERARRRLPPGDRGGDRGRARPARVHRPGRGRGAGAQGRGDPGRRLLRRRQPARRAPDRGRARAATSPSRSSTSARVEAGDLARRRPDRDRDRDRGRQHLQARDPLLRAARRDLPRRRRQGAPDRDGQLRVRAGADRRRGDRAERRRARESSGRARSRPGRSTWSRSARPARRRSRPPTGSTRSSEAAGLETLYDDRDAGPGEKLTDAELLGCPLRIVVGKRALAEGEVEAQERAQRRGPPARASPTRRRRAAEILDGGGSRARGRGRGDPSAFSKRRLFGIDRSGPAAELRPAAGAPLHPWTLPNLVGYLRLAAIPVFLVLAFDSGDGRAAARGAALPRDHARRLRRRVPRPRDRPVLAAWARCSTRWSTGSRCSPAPSSAGTSSCCRAGRWRCSRPRGGRPWSSPSWRCAAGVDLEINWIGRIGVFLVFGGIFWTHGLRLVDHRGRLRGRRRAHRAWRRSSTCARSRRSTALRRKLRRKRSSST